MSTLTRRAVLKACLLLAGMPRLVSASSTSAGVNLNEKSPILFSSEDDYLSGGVFDGKGGVILVDRQLTLRNGTFKNVTFAPSAGYKGSGPIFKARNGNVTHDQVSVIGFLGGGCKVISDEDNENNSFIAIGACKYNSNGGLVRCRLAKRANLKLSGVLYVDEENVFSPGDFVWVGDGKFKVEKVFGRSVILEKKYGITKVYHGWYDKAPIGQFVTKDANDKNGIRIGSGGYGWTIDTTNASVECSNNAWFGLFHYSKKYAGLQSIENIKTINNGFCNIGLGFVNAGFVRKCLSSGSGNNGIDIFESKSGVIVSDNVVMDTGVDGIFVGGNGESANVFDNKIKNAARIGLLINGRGNAINGIKVYDNVILNSGMNSLTLTAVGNAEVRDNILDGSSLRPAIFLEARKGVISNEMPKIHNNVVKNSPLGPLGGQHVRLPTFVTTN